MDDAHGGDAMRLAEELRALVEDDATKAVLESPTCDFVGFAFALDRAGRFVASTPDRRGFAVVTPMSHDYAVSWLTDPMHLVDGLPRPDAVFSREEDAEAALQAALAKVGVDLGTGPLPPR